MISRWREKKLQLYCFLSSLVIRRKLEKKKVNNITRAKKRNCVFLQSNQKEKVLFMQYIQIKLLIIAFIGDHWNEKD